jgi:hypothetical protein
VDCRQKGEGIGGRGRAGGGAGRGDGGGFEVGEPTILRAIGLAGGLAVTGEAVVERPLGSHSCAERGRSMRRIQEIGRKLRKICRLRRIWWIYIKKGVLGRS